MGDQPAALVRADTARGVATLTLDSPHNRNALSSVLVAQLRDALSAAERDDAVRVIVLSHTGTAFCSGADLREATDDSFPALAGLSELLAAISQCDKPVVARVGGPARAGGLGLIAAADLAVCSTDATFAFSEVRLGVIPAVISAVVLPRLSSRAAQELYLTGEPFDGVRAAEVGLVTRAVAAAALDATVHWYTALLLRGGPRALAGVKALLRSRYSATLSDDLAELSNLSQRYFASDEGLEGIRAFREKRDPTWAHGD